MPIADLTTLVNATAQNLSQLKGLSVAYNLLGGAPTIAGYTSLINGNNSSNFGAGAGVTFNDENVYINVLNALYQGNAGAKTAFDAIVGGGATLSDKITLAYNSIVPASARSDAGLNYLKAQAAFYEARAVELNIAGPNGAALVAYAAIAKIAVDNDIGGLGDTVNDLVAAVKDGSAALPEDGAVFTPLETADGTNFDSDDAPVTDPNVGTTFTLTTGVDTLTGTNGNDTFIGDNTGADTTSTADTLNGGNGTDVFNLFSDGAAGNMPTLNSVETLNVYDQDANFDVSTSSSLTTVNLIRGDGAMTQTIGKGVTTVGLQDIALTGAAADAGIVIAAEATATELTVNTSGITTAGADADEDVTLTGAALATVNVNATGDTATDEFDVAGAKAVNINATGKFTTADLATSAASGGTVTVTGAGAVDLGTLDVGFDSIDASAATGGLTAAIGAAKDTVVKGSTGNDVITADTTDALVAADKLAVDAGAGTGDVLVITQTADVDTAADAARYTNFEIIRTADSVDMSLVAGVTGLQITGGTSETYSKMSADQAKNVTFQADNTVSTVFSLATGTAADEFTFNLASATATTNVDVIGVNVTDAETVNIVATTGTDATSSNFGFLANSADSVKAINVSGTADVELNVVANTFDTVAVAVDASGLTGTGSFTFDDASGIFAGSSVKGSANADALDIAAAGSTFDGAAGDDNFIVSGGQAGLENGGVFTTITGGEGTDTATFTNDDSTFVDSNFKNVTGVEKIVVDGSNAANGESFTTGGFFDANFKAAGVDLTYTSGDEAATIDATTFSGAATVTVTAGGTTNNTTVNTGTGADKITIDATAATTGNIVVSSGAGDDSLALTVDGANLGASSSEITMGAGKDAITFTGLVAADAAVIDVNIGAGDSTIAAYDTIAGWSDGDAASSVLLDFAGSAIDAVDQAAASVTGFTAAELTFSIANGVLSFAGSSAAGLSLEQKIGLVDTLVTTNLSTVAFEHTGNTYVYNENSGGDSLVELTGITGITALGDGVTADNGINIG